MRVIFIRFCLAIICLTIFASASEMKEAGESLEKAVDPATYIVGPGDVLAVNIWTGMEQQYLLTINPEGNITIPTVGDIDIKQKTLAEAKGLIISAAGKVYRTSEISVFLTKLRRFRIPVSGVIVDQGIYEASAVDRVTQLLERAGGLITEEDIGDTLPPRSVTNPIGVWRKRQKAPVSSKRNILLIHSNGDTTRVDLLNFLRNNDLTNNPFVTEGDMIYVPAKATEVGVVEVLGAVKIPGTIEYAAGDRVRDMIELCGGFSDDAKLDEVSLIRFLDNSQNFESITLDLNSEGSDWNFPLQGDDRIIVHSLPKYHQRQKVMIIGEVQFPGMYPIIQGETTLKAVITQAGGFTPYANLKEAEIIRIMEKELSDPDIEWMNRIPIENMTRMEYEYYKSNIREKTELVVDFDALFNGGDSTQDITLCHQDVINIPYQTRTVRVQGQVARPGLVEWMPDKNYLYYIEQAGSFVYNAKKGKIRVIRADSGKWLKPSRSLRINIGDTIFVPEKPEVNNWVVFKDALLAISQLVTIYVLVKTL